MSRKMINENQILGKTLKECLEDINTKLDNHVAHSDEKTASLESLYTKMAEKVNAVDDKVIALKTDVVWIKWISMTVLISILGLGFGLAVQLFAI